MPPTRRPMGRARPRARLPESRMKQVTRHRMRKLGRFVFLTLKGGIIVYAMVVGILWFMQDTLLYHRSAGAPMLNDPMLLPKREIVCLTTADGLDLRSWYFKPARADLPTAVFFH